MRSLRITIILVLILAQAAPDLALAQVGGPPTPPPTLWNFMGIPQGWRKLRGATSNRRGNNPQREPKPPLKAIADPDNLESQDKSIKKAAEVKQAEDLKKQKIKAVKYLTKIGCGCYDIDGGVTEALVASAGDCTEEVRYETVKAISDAAEGECCSKCGKVCCCNKDIMTKLAAMAYERDDTGCYLEPSERVREAAAEALEICCPNDTLPVIVPEVKEEEAPDPEQRKGDEEEVEAPESESEELPGLNPDSDDVEPKADEVVTPLPRRPVPSYPQQQGELRSGVVVHVSGPNQLAHVRFGDASTEPRVGSQMIAYRIENDQPVAIAKLHVVQSSTGAANVTASKGVIERLTRGDLIACPVQIQTAKNRHPAPESQQIAVAQPAVAATSTLSQATPARDEQTSTTVSQPCALPLTAAPKASSLEVIAPSASGNSPQAEVSPSPSHEGGPATVDQRVQQAKHMLLEQPQSVLPNAQLLR